MEADAIPFAKTWVTSADLARLYLNIRWKAVRRRITTLQWKEFYEKPRSMPLWAEPCTLENGYYIDIRSAYWTILRAVGWNVDYMPNKWLKVSDDLTVNDFPFEQNKMARNCLVSLAADGSRAMRLWTGTGIEYKKGGNPIVNKMLYAFVADVLNGVASECIASGAVYSFTDGFICPDDRVEEIDNIITSWGLSAGIKHRGPTEIKGVGAYKIGDASTRKFHRQHTNSIHKVNPVAAEWLKPRLKHFSDKYRATEPFEEWRYVQRASRKTLRG